MPAVEKGRTADLLAVFITSGNPTDLTLALETARAQGLKTMAVLGKTGGTAKGKARHEIIVPGKVTDRIRKVQTFVLHACLTHTDADIE